MTMSQWIIAAAELRIPWNSDFAAHRRSWSPIRPGSPCASSAGSPAGSTRKPAALALRSRSAIHLDRPPARLPYTAVHARHLHAHPWRRAGYMARRRWRAGARPCPEAGDRLEGGDRDASCARAGGHAPDQRAERRSRGRGGAALSLPWLWPQLQLVLLDHARHAMGLAEPGFIRPARLAAPARGSCCCRSRRSRKCANKTMQVA